MSKNIEDTVVKIITIDKNAFSPIQKALEPFFNVVPTSKPIFDAEKNRYHMFLRLFKKAILTENAKPKKVKVVKL